MKVSRWPGVGSGTGRSGSTDKIPNLVPHDQQALAPRTGLLGKTLGASVSSQGWKLSKRGRDRSCRSVAIRAVRSSQESVAQPPVVQRQPVTVPPQQFDLVPAATAEHEQVARQRIATQALSHQRSQRVKALPHVRRRQADVNPNQFRQTQHGGASSTASTSASICRSKPARTRTTRPCAKRSRRRGPALPDGPRPTPPAETPALAMPAQVACGHDGRGPRRSGNDAGRHNGLSEEDSHATLTPSERPAGPLDRLKRVFLSALFDKQKAALRLLGETFIPTEGHHRHSPALNRRRRTSCRRDGPRIWTVDYLAEVWLNGMRVGEHVGGETPFVLDFEKTSAFSPPPSGYCKTCWTMLLGAKTMSKHLISGNDDGVTTS